MHGNKINKTAIAATFALIPGYMYLVSC